MKIDAKTDVRRQFPSVHVGGFPTISATRDELAGMMITDCLLAREAGEERLPRCVFSSNGQGVALAGRSSKFRDAMLAADIIHADGMPVVFASRMTRHPLPERVATTDFFHDAARKAEQYGLRFFFLGGTEAQNIAAVEGARRMYPRLQISGRRNGYFSDSENAEVCAQIRASGTDVLWVALGKPKQEYWSVSNREHLGGVGWIKTCGGLFSFLGGSSPRAPAWMQRLGLEWLYRGYKEPGRLGMRYLTTNPYAMYRLLLNTEKTRWHG